MKHRSKFVWRLILPGLLFVLMLSVLSGVSLAEQSTWDCPNPECGRIGNTGKFCGSCGQPSPTPISNPATEPTPKPVNAGDIVTFGCYEQDNNTKNGSEAIEWIVLDVDKKKNKAFLLSRYGLCSELYNIETMDITWEKCTLREWLNDGFLNSAFTAQEQAAILTTKVDNSASQSDGVWVYTADGGNDTMDKIFLLSYAEANRYFGVTVSDDSNVKARVAPTAYAIAQGAYYTDDDEQWKTEDGQGAGWWWLRSPGSGQDSADIVLYFGSLSDTFVGEDDGIVRPALWISLESGIL